ncbi:hypothetical protein F2P81_001634 [Scophthalmus maximus]|uniref:Uncharacterized protein n=1 Tax=Scophthalmus maximus TaxID=52904 RepID=A0A6A4TIR2_SCOMX|nr:hypothetical protein F2P81_001634 [Scophthalmus maximus]
MKTNIELRVKSSTCANDAVNAHTDPCHTPTRVDKHAHLSKVTSSPRVEKDTEDIRVMKLRYHYLPGAGAKLG